MTRKRSDDADAAGPGTARSKLQVQSASQASPRAPITRSPWEKAVLSQQARGKAQDSVFLVSSQATPVLHYGLHTPWVEGARKTVLHHGGMAHEGAKDNCKVSQVI